MAPISLGAMYSYLPLILISMFILRGIHRRYIHPLRRVPGPFLASTTNLWRLAVFLRGRQHHEYLALFKKYGPLVRLGPNTVILDDPAHFPEYWGWDKSPWWDAFLGNPDVRGHAAILSMKEHIKGKSMVSGAYSMSHMLKGENKVDGHILELMEQFYSRCGTVFDLAPWMQWVAFDISMNMAFSNPPGFVKSGSDVGQLILSLHALMTKIGILSIFPTVVKFIHLPWVFPFIGPKTTDTKGPGAMYSLAWKQVKQRFETKDHEKPIDILQWLIDHENNGGERLSRQMLEHEAQSPVLAGSDTAATTIRAIVLFVTTNRRVLDKLHREIDAANAAGLFSTPPKYLEIKQHVPYMANIMREAIRLYPVLGLPSFREVPKDGATICGYRLPGKTEVGMCQYATGRNTTTFGPDAHRFRPERWTGDADPATKKLRELGEVGFGSGGMACTGRNLATMEVWKIATELFRQFEFEILDAIQPWHEKDSLTMLVWNFNVKIDLRPKYARALGL